MAKLIFSAQTVWLNDRRFWRCDEITIAQKLAKRATHTFSEGSQVEAVLGSKAKLDYIKLHS